MAFTNLYPSAPTSVGITGNTTLLNTTISSVYNEHAIVMTADGNIECTSINRINIDELNAKMDALIATVDKMVERINDQIAQEGGELLRTVTQIVEMNRTIEALKK